MYTEVYAAAAQKGPFAAPERFAEGLDNWLARDRFLMAEAVTLTVEEKPVRFEVAARPACREVSKDPAPVIWGSGFVHEKGLWLKFCGP
ncbi:hypothetical protein ACFW6N_32110 [Streptomyces cyaneofuscatus]|uniref:hypothetical protein n=1 Tax=Streptomyces cyaneofuscatus TaxID=66883 RepID=UPI00369CCF80